MLRMIAFFFFLTKKINGILTTRISTCRKTVILQQILERLVSKINCGGSNDLVHMKLTYGKAINVYREA